MLLEGSNVHWIDMRTTGTHAHDVQNHVGNRGVELAAEATPLRRLINAMVALKNAPVLSAIPETASRLTADLLLTCFEHALGVGSVSARRCHADVARERFLLRFPFERAAEKII